MSYNQFCPIAKAAEILCERWTILIIRELLLGNSRFGDLQRALSGISPALLTKRLKELERNGLVAKRSAPGSKRSEYLLTESGRALQDIVLSLGSWGMDHARGHLSDDEMDIELLVFDMQRGIKSEQLPLPKACIGLHFTDQTKYARWWIKIDHDKRELCTEAPNDICDLSISCTARDMIQIWMGDAVLAQARLRKQISIDGDPLFVDSIEQWIGLNYYAGHPRAER